MNVRICVLSVMAFLLLLLSPACLVVEEFSRQLSAAGVTVDNIRTVRGASQEQVLGVNEVFAPDTGNIYVRFSIQGIMWNTPLKIIWTANTPHGSRRIAEISQVMSAMSKEGEMFASPPEGGWPAGQYSIEFFVHSQRVGLAHFTVSTDTKTTSPPGGGTPPVRRIETGSAIALALESVGSQGGTITVKSPGNPLDGMTISVPAGALPGTVEFRVSSRPVLRHDLGPYANPLSPLITVKNGGGYSEKSMTVRVPVRVPPGHFAMPFFFEEESGKLEGIPMIKADADSVTFITRHFSSIIILSQEWNLINKALPVDTGFRPGTDDWQFVNYGSALAPGGHCAGQSLAAMYYYYERRKAGEPQLHGRYDNSPGQETPELWEDDKLGYRLCSVLQHDMQWGTRYTEEAIKFADTCPDLVWRCFVYSMLLLGDPQFVGVHRFDDKGNSIGGHAVIAYRAEAGKLFVADPNFPGARSEERFIPYSPGKLGPYVSAENAKEIEQGNATEYRRVGYYAKTALVPWEQTGKRWKELDNGTVGQRLFNNYEIFIVDKTRRAVPVRDGFSTDAESVDIVWRKAPGSGKPATSAASVYSFRNGEYVNFRNRKVELHPGINRLGVLVEEKKQTSQNDVYHWTDFQWITINRFSLKVQPASAKGKIKSPMYFEIIYEGTVENPRFEWLFGDGSNWKRASSPRTNHIYASPGKYVVMARLYDNNTGKLLGEGRAEAHIEREERTSTAKKPEKQPVKEPAPSPDIAGKDGIIATRTFTGSFGAVSLKGLGDYDTNSQWHQFDVPPGHRVAVAVKWEGRQARNPDHGNAGQIHWYEQGRNAISYIGVGKDTPRERFSEKGGTQAIKVIPYVEYNDSARKYQLVPATYSIDVQIRKP